VVALRYAMRDGTSNQKAWAWAWAWAWANSIGLKCVNNHKLTNKIPTLCIYKNEIIV